MLTWAWYTAILFLAGTTSAGGAVAHSPRWQRRLTAAAVFASLLVLLLVVTRLWAQTSAAFGGDGPLEFAHVRIILYDTPWGGGWRWQAGVTAVAVVAVALWRTGLVPWPIAALAGSGVAFVTALTGHAVGMEDQRTLTVLAHGTHVIAAGWWLGALTAILLVTAGEDLEGDAEARTALARAIDRFSPIAIVAVSVLVVAGGVASWRHVFVPAGLGGIASPYGLALAGKVAAFCGAALCGLYNWRVLRPTLAASATAARQLRSMAWLEVTMGVIALVLTAVLGTLSMPERGDAPSHTARSTVERGR